MGSLLDSEGRSSRPLLAAAVVDFSGRGLPFGPAGDFSGLTASGSTTAIGGNAPQLVYGASGRLGQVKRAGTVVMNYTYSGRGEQVRRVGKTNTYTLYDESGHWIGDYDNNGAALQQAIWLDDLPVGVLAKNSLQYVQPDHLGTPRAVIDPVRDVAIWRWDLKGGAFGNTTPDQDPDGMMFLFDLRFPGQRYDAPSGLNQNYFRDYESGTGRCVQSDPIGLSGGISTYGYISSRPLVVIDPIGLSCKSAGGTTRCDYPGGPSFSLPTPHGWRDFDGSEGMYHRYDVRRKLGYAYANGVMQDLINHPTPLPNARPATSSGTKKERCGSSLFAYF
jgi:RHS repeat-associated protein